MPLPKSKNFLLSFENVVDPLGGSWYLEELTNRIESKVENYFTEINNIGGVIPAIEQGYFQREIARSASDYQSKIDSKTRIVVGVNDFIKHNEKIDIPILEINPKTTSDQLKKLERLKNSRNNTDVKKALNQLTIACKENINLMYPIINAVKKDATLGEIIDAMKVEFGEWQESSVF